MKKLFSLIVVMAMAIVGASANAQTVESSRFFDNWSIGLKGGVTTPLNHAEFWGDMRPVVGLEFVKEITPIFGMGVEATWTVNTSPWQNGVSNKLSFDRQYVGYLSKVNLMNALGGYLGSPRLFEIEAIAGIGWQHDYIKGVKWTQMNSWYTRFGANFNFNLGKEKAWVVAFKPSIVFNMHDEVASDGFNLNRANLELLAGVAYRFKNSNGTHSFKLCDKKFTQEEVDVLNAEINRLRCALDECNNKPVAVEVREVIKEVVNEKTTVVQEFPPITFNQGSSVVSAESTKTIEWIASELNKNNVPVVIDGFASEEGTATFNKTLSLKRAEAVKAILVKNGVDINRITTIGNGATTKFGDTRANNRIVITTVK